MKPTVPALRQPHLRPSLRHPHDTALLLGILTLCLSLPTSLRADKGESVPTPPPQISPAAGTTGPKLPIPQAEPVLLRFYEKYTQAAKPRLLIYVNRTLERDPGFLVETGKTVRSIQTKGDPVPLENGGIQIGNDNKNTTTASPSGQGGERKETTTSSTRQNPDPSLGTLPLTEAEIRQVEESFQKVFFDARTKLVDQRIAELSSRSPTPIGDRFLTAKDEDRESAELKSLRASTDVVVELLVRQTRVTLSQPSGQDEVRDRLALTATAVRLQDGLKLAQIDSDTLFGFNERRGDRRERLYVEVTSAEIIQQTALGLMQRLEF